jgi:hypothetical protein
LLLLYEFAAVAAGEVELAGRQIEGGDGEVALAT